MGNVWPDITRAKAKTRDRQIRETDTGFSPLPVPIPIEKVDAAKQAALEDILRVRPIYTLQGPPGTGKTTLVAHLLEQFWIEITHNLRD